MRKLLASLMIVAMSLSCNCASVPHKDSGPKDSISLPDITIEPDAPAKVEAEVGTLPNLPIILSGVINDEMAGNFEKLVEGELKGNPEKITIIIDSPGGLVSAGRTISRTIESTPVPTECIVDGEAASMAFYILQSCTVRSMTKRSVLMVHHALLILPEDTRETLSEMENEKASLEAINKAALEQYANRMKISKEEIEKKIANDKQWWLNYDEAMETGAVDKVAPIPSEADKAELRKKVLDFVKKLGLPDKL